jgi:hypothetical protein
VQKRRVTTPLIPEVPGIEDPRWFSDVSPGPPGKMMRYGTEFEAPSDLAALGRLPHCVVEGKNQGQTHPRSS